MGSPTRSSSGSATVDGPDDEVVDLASAPEEGSGSTQQGWWRRLTGWGKGLRPSWKGLFAYLLFQALAFAIWVVPILPRFGRQALGVGLQDSRYFQWALSWTPFAVAHHLNPLHTGYLFPPGGVDLAWSAFIPGPAIVMWPVTALFSPLVSLNLLMATAPALAAWAAYLVCHRITNRFWPSVAGGYLFGFSAYVAGNTIGFVNLVLIFPIPLLVYLVIRRVEGSLGPVAFVAGFAALLVGLFSISTELFGTAAIFGAIAFIGALAFVPTLRQRLLRMLPLMLLAGGIATVALLPYLFDIISNRPSEPLYPADLMAAPDLWTFVVPPPYVRLGGDALYPLLSRHTANPVLDGLGYVGLGVIAVVVGFAITERRRLSTWLLLGFLALVTLLSLGPVLHIGGDPHGWLPERLLAQLPIIQSATPSRFTLYSTLTIGVIAAVWLSDAPARRAWMRWAVVIAAGALVLPQAPHHVPPQQIPRFLSSDQVRSQLNEGETVYAITAQKGDEVLWQATAGYWFKLAQGYTGPLPPTLQSGPLSRGLNMRRGLFFPGPGQFSTWMQQHGVSAIVVDDRAREKYGSLLGEVGLQQVFSGEGVSVWRPPGGVWTVVPAG